MRGQINALCISAEKGVSKYEVPSLSLIEGYGVKGDAHAGPGDRQVSVLLLEYIKRTIEKSSLPEPGAYGENIILEGLSDIILKKGSRILFDSGAVLEIRSKGKVCHDKCDIFKKMGVCAMSETGLFAVVVAGGDLNKGEGFSIEI